MAALADYIAQESHAPHDILVVFDIDNTIGQLKTEVGTDQWVDYSIKQCLAKGMTLAQAYQEIIPLYSKIQHITDLDLVEDMIPELIADLKADGVLTLGLTARHDPLIDRTLEQLAPLNVIFSKPAVDDEIIIEASKHPAVYKKGVIFCGQNSKGEVLFTFLAMLGINPKKIFFIDDKMHHLIAVEKIALEHGVECVCIHYTQCQERVDSFDPVRAAQELVALNL
jgi:phosphoglycolate phosphatase-like HAD superfamily hydrolase